jgi:hypothetical protein
VNNVLTSEYNSICSFIFSSEHQQGDARVIQHFTESGGRGDAGCWNSVELVVLEPETVDDELFEFAPVSGTAVTNEDPHTAPSGDRLLCRREFQVLRCSKCKLSQVGRIRVRRPDFCDLGQQLLVRIRTALGAPAQLWGT